MVVEERTVSKGHWGCRTDKTYQTAEMVPLRSDTAPWIPASRGVFITQ